MDRKKVTTVSLLQKKQKGEKISMLTVYDYAMARMLDDAGVDMALVGDSLGNVVLGYDTTLPVTMEDMLRHSAAVVRGIKRAMVVVDMPFMSYQINADEAVRNAGRFMSESGVHAVKLEGGRPMVATIKRIVDAGIPVVGHLGYTPQSTFKLGGPRVQGRTETAAERMIEDAKAVEAAGAFAIVLELVPKDLAKQISEMLSIPTIGIGAGPCCDGQVQVCYDLLGMFSDFLPKHAKRYANLSETITDAFRSYVDEVSGGEFPGEEQSF